MATDSTTPITADSSGQQPICSPCLAVLKPAHMLQSSLQINNSGPHMQQAMQPMLNPEGGLNGSMGMGGMMVKSPATATTRAVLQKLSPRVGSAPVFHASVVSCTRFSLPMLCLRRSNLKPYCRLKLGPLLTICCSSAVRCSSPHPCRTPSILCSRS